ncbi:MAG: hypothetical protein M1308_23705 [Actinobacteria bacterium]|nr:hypothetical protein [Actinomycetota bacterium]
MKKGKTLVFVILILLLSLATHYRSFAMDLKGEDWYQLWFAIQPDLKDVVFQTLAFRDHPITTYQEVLLAPFFKFNPFYWYFFGYICKVIGAFVVGLLVWGITKSKKAAVYSSLIFASSTIGLEAYLALYAQPPAMLIPLMCIGLYFWVISNRENSLKKYLISITFFLMAFLGDPGRSISMVALGIFWDCLSLIQNISKNQLIVSITRSVVLVVLLLAVYLVIGDAREQFRSGHPSNIINGLNYIVVHQSSVLNNFTSSLGNLLIGWFISLREFGHMSMLLYYSSAPPIAGYIFLTIIIVFVIRFLRRKDNAYKILLFFSSWIVVSFFPTWLLIQWYVGGLLPGVTGRYLAISSVGLIALLGYILSRLKIANAIFLLVVIILFNIWTANRILNQELIYRSALIHNLFWNDADRMIPKEEQSIIMIIGAKSLGSELAATHAIPLGLKRGINIAEDLPIITEDMELVKKLLCEDNVYRPDFRVYGPARFGAILQREKIPLSHLYAWRIYEDSFVDVTEQERKLLRTEVNCKLD